MQNCSSQPETIIADAIASNNVQRPSTASSTADKIEDSNLKSDENQSEFPVTSVRDTFPTKLYKILSKPVFEDVISWLPHGRSWRVLDQKRFETEVLPLYFRHGNFLSFMRQVNGWGFRRTYEDFKHNSFYHENFIRGSPDLCIQIRRPVKSKKKPRSLTYHSLEPEVCAEHQDHALSQPITDSNTTNGGISQSYASDVSTHLERRFEDTPQIGNDVIPTKFGVTQVDRFGHQPQSLSCQENIIPSLNIFQNNLNPMPQMRPEQLAGVLGSQRFFMNTANPYIALQQYRGLLSPEKNLIHHNMYDLNNWMIFQNNLKHHTFDEASLRASGDDNHSPEQRMKNVEQELLRRQFMMNPYIHHP